MVREWVGAAPAESERVDPAYYDTPEMRCVDEVVGIDPKDLAVPPLLIYLVCRNLSRPRLLHHQTCLRGVIKVLN